MYAFVLIDALPRREHDVFKALDRVRAVVSKRLLQDKVAGADIATLVEAEDEVEVERIINNELHDLAWVHSVRRVMAHHTVIGPVRNLMMQMQEEVEARKAK